MDVHAESAATDETVELSPESSADAATEAATDTDSDEARYEARVLRAFIKESRLTAIPAREKKRQVALRFLRDQCFTEDRPYPEAEVNQRLALWHRDVAALRRYMVEAGLLTRAVGIYRVPSGPKAERE